MPNPIASSPKAIVLSRETDRLARFLRIRQPVQTALATGRITKSKVAESWLYHPSTIGLDEFIEAARATTDHLLDQRLATPLSIMAGMVSAVMEPSCSKGSARALLHHLVSVDNLARLGLLTVHDEPHLAIYRTADMDEISRQLAHIRDAMNTGHRIWNHQLPEPLRPRVGRAWAETLIGHAEFAGWGRLSDGALHAWPRP